MSSLKIRDQKTDHLLTPENSAVIIIDYQPTQVGSIESMDKYTLVKNVVALIKLAKVFKMPIVVSTVNVKAAGLKSTIPQIAHEVKDLPSYDRTTINAWEDIEFLEAVKATKRKKLIIAALWTEACLLFPALDALKEGFEVYPVVDAAKKAGVRHIVFTSIALKDMKTAAIRSLMEDLYQAEDYIKENGLTYTVLRNTLYTGATPLYGGEKVIKTGISLPAGNGKVPFALRREMGEAAANTLLQNGHENQTYEITGSDLYSYGDVAQAFSVVSETTVKYTNADPVTFPSQLRKLGLPEIVVLLVTGFSADVKNHQFEIVTRDLENLLGRKPASLTEGLKEVFGFVHSVA